VVAVSDLDAQHLRELAPQAHVSTVPNGVDTSYFAAQGLPRKPAHLVFVGGFTWFPNLDAIRYFCDDVLPLVTRAVPDLRLTVIGRQPDTPVVEEMGRNPHVHLTGQVDDIRPYVDEAAAYIVPLRIGGGTRLKILDALAMSKAIISTSVGCEGLAVEDGKNIVIADTPQALSEAIVRLFKHPEEAQAIGLRGRELVEQRYDWAAVAKGLMASYAQAVGHSRPGMPS